VCRACLGPHDAEPPPPSHPGDGGEVEPESLCAALGLLDGLLRPSWRLRIRSGIKQPVAPEANAAPEEKHHGTE
jgi:hypothetical protein